MITDEIFFVFAIFFRGSASNRTRLAFIPGAIVQRREGETFRVVTDRQKTGMFINNIIPTWLGEELLKVKNGNPKFFFWSGTTTAEDAPSYFQKLFHEENALAVAEVSQRFHDLLVPINRPLRLPRCQVREGYIFGFDWTSLRKFQRFLASRQTRVSENHRVLLVENLLPNVLRSEDGFKTERNENADRGRNSYFRAHRGQ